MTLSHHLPFYWCLFTGTYCTSPVPTTWVGYFTSSIAWYHHPKRRLLSASHRGIVTQETYFALRLLYLYIFYEPLKYTWQRCENTWMPTLYSIVQCSTTLIKRAPREVREHLRYGATRLRYGVSSFLTCVMLKSQFGSRASLVPTTIE